MIILATLALGLLIGWIAQAILGRRREQVNWGMALVAGFGGALVGGLIGSLLFGDGLSIKPAGLIGTLIGALIITAIWMYFENRRMRERRDVEHKAARSGRHH